MTRPSPLALFPLLCLVTPAPAQSAWVDFTDETATLLVGAAGSIADDREKDLAAADLDLDGDMDLLMVRKVPFQFEGGHSNVLFMNQNGMLVDRTAAFIPSFLDVDNSRDVTVFHANGDVWPDIVVANTIYEQPRLWINQGVNGQGNFLGFVEDPLALATLQVVMMKFCAVSAADVDGDGDEDLYFSDYRNTLEDRLLINDGTGIFTDETATRLSPSAANSVFVIDSDLADFDNDGRPDILKVEDASGPLKIVYNDGTGHFFDEQTISIPVTHHAVIADFDNDGRRDLYVITYGQDYLFRNTGLDASGHVEWLQIAVTESLVAAQGGNVIEADLDQDGYVDLLVSDVNAFEESCDRRFAALRNTSGATGTVSVEDPNELDLQPWNVQGVHDSVAMDVDGDGFLDVVQGTCTGLRVWRMTPFTIPGTPYCETSPSSAGDGARIHASGSTSLADNDFHLVVEDGIAGQFGVFYYGPNQQQTPFGNGLRCIGGVTHRLLPSITMGASGGLGARRLDFDEPPANGGSGAITPGSTWNFQFWYRDPAAGGAFFNLSDATEVTFLP